jgi:Bifunctional DNA primase/polymerase, N-terminal
LSPDGTALKLLVMTKKLEDHDFVDDAPPTQPQGMLEAPTLQQVRAEAEVLPFFADDQAIRELYAHFGVKAADDLAKSDWREFIQLANMSCEERAAVVRRKRTAPTPIDLELNGNNTVTMRDKAVALAKMGFRIFPVKQGTKAPAQPPNKPRPPKGRYHQHIPSRDPAEVAAMWTGLRGASLPFDIGINTEGLLVLDIDDRDGRTGTESFAKLAAQHGLDLDTVVASTPSGGRHYFYKLPTDIDPATVGFGSDKLGSGIDHRSYNSLVVAAGTKRANGEYRWVRSPTESDMKEAPRSLVELCQRQKERQAHDPLVVPGFEVDPPDAIERFREYAKARVGVTTP